MTKDFLLPFKHSISPLTFKRNAKRILEINDYPEEVVSDAVKISIELDESFFISTNNE